MITLLPESGSSRKYYRIKGKSKTVIAVFSEDKKENSAFISFSKHFHNHGLKVPQIYEHDLENNIYFQQDTNYEPTFYI